jgi:hypothetical protein
MSVPLVVIGRAFLSEVYRERAGGGGAAVSGKPLSEPPIFPQGSTRTSDSARAEQTLVVGAERRHRQKPSEHPGDVGERPALRHAAVFREAS